MADAAAANGVPKKIIPHDVAQFTADAVQNPVSWICLVLGYGSDICSIISIRSFSRSLSWWSRRVMGEFCSSLVRSPSSLSALLQ